MADICEICMEFVGFWEEGATIDYEIFVLCSKCNEEVDLLYEKHEGKKNFEECIKIIRKRVRARITKNEK